jgi:hypothetical protein
MGPLKPAGVNRRAAVAPSKVANWRRKLRGWAVDDLGSRERRHQSQSKIRRTLTARVLPVFASVTVSNSTSTFSSGSNSRSGHPLY